MICHSIEFAFNVRPLSIELHKIEMKHRNKRKKANTKSEFFYQVMCVLHGTAHKCFYGRSMIGQSIIESSIFCFAILHTNWVVSVPIHLPLSFFCTSTCFFFLNVFPMVWKVLMVFKQSIAIHNVYDICNSAATINKIVCIHKMAWQIQCKLAINRLVIDLNGNHKRPQQHHHFNITGQIIVVFRVNCFYSRTGSRFVNRFFLVLTSKMLWFWMEFCQIDVQFLCVCVHFNFLLFWAFVKEISSSRWSI